MSGEASLINAAGDSVGRKVPVLVLSRPADIGSVGSPPPRTGLRACDLATS
jgi:hypothetical protein